MANDYEEEVLTTRRNFQEKWFTAHPNSDQHGPPAVVKPEPMQPAQEVGDQHVPGDQVNGAPAHADQQAAQNGQCNVRLPKLELPKFSGDVLKYFAFWQQFADSIDSRENLAFFGDYQGFIHAYEIPSMKLKKKIDTGHKWIIS